MADPTIKRRQFMAGSAGFAGIWLLSALPARSTAAPAPAALDPADPRAVAVGYTRNHRSVDLARWPKKAREQKDAPQRCSTCALRSEAGGCSLFGGRSVDADGWCNAWTGR